MRDDGDPRLTGELVRELPGSADGNDVVLVGVVHDHPASTYRVRAVVEAIRPEVLALELPPLAIPLFRRYADDAREPPTFGGEMSAAIQAATGEPTSGSGRGRDGGDGSGSRHSIGGGNEPRVVGIDGPSVGFLRRLLVTLYRGDAGPAIARAALRSLASVTRHAVACRLAAVLAARTGVRVEVGSPVAHECRRGDDPREQARDERRQIDRSRAVASVLGTPDVVALRDAAREGHMADRLSALRREGDVVAVVGVDHVASLAERLGRST